jgi:predicted cupin superfamily sugar epimerase
MIASNYRDGNGDLDTWMTSREKTYALKQMPSFVEYCNYVYPLVSCVIGPSFEFKDWNDFLNMK